MVGLTAIIVYFKYTRHCVINESILTLIKFPKSLTREEYLSCIISANV